MCDTENFVEEAAPRVTHDQEARNDSSPSLKPGDAPVDNTDKSAGIKHRRRKPGERVTRSAAIQSFCRECVGWDADGYGSVKNLVRACTCEECWLWPYRTGKEDR